MAGNGSSRRVGIGGGGGSPKKLNLRDHCLLCLQPQKPSTFRRKRNLRIQKDFQPILHYLTGSDPTFDRSRLECERMGIPVMMTFAPPMCPLCLDTLAGLHQLHEQLQNLQYYIQRQTEKARKILTCGGAITSRQSFFAKLMTSSDGSDSEKTKAVAQLVGNLHNKIIEEGNKNGKLIYPSRLPPNFTPRSSTEGARGNNMSWHPKRSGMAPANNSASMSVVIPEVIRSSTTGSNPILILRRKTETGGGGRGGVQEESTIKSKLARLPSPGPEQTLKSEEEDQAAGADESSVVKVEENTDSIWEELLDTFGGAGDDDEVIGDMEMKVDTTTASPPAPTDHEDEDDGGEEEFGRSRRKLMSVLRPRNCDLCGEPVSIHPGGMVKHLEDSHNLKGYIVFCPYPNCNRPFSCRGRSEKHWNQVHRVPVPPTWATAECGACHAQIGWKVFPQHLQNHECALKEKNIPCPIPDCSHRYALKQSVEEHLVTHDLRRRAEQKCSECGELLKIDLVEEHLKEVHGASEVLCCKWCPFRFPSWESLLDHLYDHRARGGLSCDLCEDSAGFKFYKHESFCQHYFNVHQLGKQFLCEKCDKQFFSRRGLTSHLQTHLDQQNGKSQQNRVFKRLKCDLCPETSFTTKDALLTHNILEHGGPPLPCKFCPKTFQSAETLRKHQRGHLGITRSHVCIVEGCGKVYTCMAQLKKHRLAKHSSGSKPYVCDSCGQGFNYMQGLNKHVDRVHLGKPLHQGPRVMCEECGEDFATNLVLKKHKLIHTGERPHQCPTCGQRFRTKDVLRRHEKGHQSKGDGFKPNGPMKKIRKRVTKSPAT